MSDKLDSLQEVLGYRFRDLELLQRALRHASAGGDQESNERLEFLGDAVVGLVVSEHLFRVLPAAPEGQMTVTKSAVVSRRAMARVAGALGLYEHIVTDEGLRTRRCPPSVLAGAYEAVVGAVLMDGGVEAARRFVLHTMEAEVEKAVGDRSSAGCKSLLQEKSQADGLGLPEYEIVTAEGPHHRRRFQAVASIGGAECGRGWGTTKKEAEQNAARDALDNRYPGWDGYAGEG